MHRLYLLSATVAVFLVACGIDQAGNLRPDGGSPDEDTPIPSGVGGLPCDVSALLATNCQTCHGNTPSNGAPFPLVSYRDLTAKNAGGIMIAQRAVTRMTSTTSPMPPMPASPVSAAEIAVFERWAMAGAPANAAGCNTSPGPFDGPVVCTSGTHWSGSAGAPVMNPGLACIACHVRDDDAIPRIDNAIPKDDAPQFRIAGTVYPTGHEPDLCNGASTGTVEVTDAMGRITALPVNAAGNFFTTSAIQFPIHVAVIASTRRRAMVSSPPVGDCNHCHTQDGANGAPGRITLP